MILENEGRKFKAFTLCMISNPSACGYDQLYTQWKQQSSNRNGSERTKKIVVNSSAYDNAITNNENMNNNQIPLVGKIVFLKD